MGLHAAGTADPGLRASALAMGDQMIVVLDLVGVDPPLVAAIRQALGDGDGLVHVVATHTHAGPCVLRAGLGQWSPEAVEAVVAASVTAAARARAAREPTTVEWLAPIEPGVAVDRRHGVQAEGGS